MFVLWSSTRPHGWKDTISYTTFKVLLKLLPPNQTLDSFKFYMPTSTEVNINFPQKKNPHFKIFVMTPWKCHSKPSFLWYGQNFGKRSRAQGCRPDNNLHTHLGTNHRENWFMFEKRNESRVGLSKIAWGKRNFDSSNPSQRGWWSLCFISLWEILSFHAQTHQLRASRCRIKGHSECLWKSSRQELSLKMKDKHHN